MIIVDKYKKTGREKWKYELTDQVSYSYPTENVWGEKLMVECDWYRLTFFHDIEGRKHIQVRVKTGYAWDGLTGFPDKTEWLSAALVHDVLLQAIYDHKLLPKSGLNEAHRLMRDILKTQTESGWATLIYIGLRAFHKPWNWITSCIK